MIRRTVITGLGPISSVGIGVNNFWNGIRSARTGLKKVDLHGYEYWAHQIEDFDLNVFNFSKHALSVLKNEKAGNDRDFDFLIAAIQLAIEHSNLLTHHDNKRIGLILFHENPNLGSFNERIIDLFKINNLLNKTKKEIVDYVYNNLKRHGYDLQTFTSLFYISRLFNLHGFSLFINNACCSGLYALETAADLIRTGKCDAVIVAGSDAWDIFKFKWFDDLNMYSKNGVTKPFSLDRSGFAIGEGGCAIVMEAYEIAQQRSADIWAEYIGGCFRLESWKMSMPAILERHYYDVISDMKLKLSEDSLEVDALCPHAIGTGVFDLYEGGIISQIFNKNVKYVPFKQYLGHTLGISALLETVALILTMKFGVIPPVLSHVYDSRIPIKLSNEFEKVQIKCSVKTCSSFGGYDAAVAFKAV